MPEENPSNAVLLAKLDGLKDVVLANQVSNHEAQNVIITQTTKTNGRVTALEKSKNMLAGALILINVIVLPVLIALILKYLKA